jgi:hypothetical protein
LVASAKIAAAPCKKILKSVELTEEELPKLL